MVTLSQNERDALDDIFNSIYTKKCKYTMIKNMPSVVNKKVQLFYHNLFRELKPAS